MAYSIELGVNREPTTCDCCGGEIGSAFGFIYKDNNAYAIYQSTWSMNHPDAGIDMTIELGEFQEENDARDRYRVAILVKSEQGQYTFGFLEPADSAWFFSSNQSRMITRNEALHHKNRTEFIEIAMFILSNDKRIIDAAEHIS